MGVEAVSPIVTLTDFEVEIISQLASQRHEIDRQEGVCNNRIGKQSDSVTDIEGAAAELAFCKVFNLYPDFSTSPRKGGWDAISRTGMSIDVKATHYSSGHLIVAKTKRSNDSDIYVLAVGRCPTYRLAGWAYADELIHNSNIKDLGYGKSGECYALSQKDLRPISSKMLSAAFSEDRVGNLLTFDNPEPEMGVGKGQRRSFLTSEV